MQIFVLKNNITLDKVQKNADRLGHRKFLVQTECFKLSILAIGWFPYLSKTLLSTTYVNYLKWPALSLLTNSIS